MKPAFALDLSQDALTLLYRLDDGWADLGRVGFDDPDLEARIADLRVRAEALAAAHAPGGVTTKLILPDSQILYTEVDAPGPDAASRRAQIAAALEGRTPYPVADLAFDWSRAGGAVQVAVVARVTLAEAEDFAATRGFNPVAFVARPAPGRFAGEPFFGQAAGAAGHLPEGARLDRDQDPVRIVPLPPELAAALSSRGAGATVTPDEIEPPAAETAAMGAWDSAEPDISDAEPAATPAPDAEVRAAPIEPDVAAPAPEETESVETVSAPEAATVEPTIEPAAEPVAEAAPEPVPEPAQAADGAAEDTVAEAPFIAVDDLVDDLPEESAAAIADEAAAPGPDRPQVPAFASRRSGGPAADPAALLAEATGRLHLLADEPTVVRPAPRLGPAAADLAVTAPDIDVPQSGMAAEDEAEGTSRRKGTGRTALTALPEARHGTQAQLRARQGQGRQGAQGATAPGATGAATGQGRRAATTVPPGRTRLGLVLVALLLLVMAAVALWSAWFGADPAAEPEPQSTLSAPEDTALAAPSDTPAEAPAAAEAGTAPETSAAAEPAPEPAETTAAPTAAPEPAPAPPSETEAAPEPAAPATAATPGQTEPADAVTAALAEALAPEAEPEADPEVAEVATAPAVTPAVAPPAAATPAETSPPVWTGAPEAGATAADDLSSGAAALAAATDAGSAELPEAPGTLAAGPAAAPTDAAPGLQPLPPPFGTVITFGPDGRIVATPDGVITPDGFTLFAGRPPMVPAAAPRPGTVAAVAPAPAATPALAPLPEPVDPAHAAKTPRLRPEAIVTRAAAARTAAPVPAVPATAEPVAPASAAAPPAATEGALPPPVDPAHAALNPKLRPEAVVTRAEAARAQAATIAAAAEAAARAEAEALANASRLAVASSRRPSERPSGLAKAVEAAVAAAVATPPEPEPQPAAAPEPEPAAASAPAPAEIDEPEPTETVPNMPTTVTVARQATVKNAIDLGKINLIGVYGSSSNRRALVRMPNGRLVKVKIGDRLDGGQVAAIGDSELTYVKGGRSVTLKIMKNG